MTKLQLRIICYVLIIPAVVVLNYAVAQPILIPDPCEETVPGWAEIFYTIDSGTGFHPEPNLLNLVFTLSVGILSAHFLSTVISRRYLKQP